MSEVPQQPKQNWRLGAVIGVMVVVCLGVSKAVEKSLAPHLGDWGAFGVSLLAVLVVAGIVGAVAQRVTRK